MRIVHKAPGCIPIVWGALFVLLPALIAGQTSIPAPAPFCSWGTAVEVGVLDPEINEASGMAVSARYPNRLYHINDSGDRGRFLVTDMKGVHAQSVSIDGFTPSDVEDLAIGPCASEGAGGGDCLFLADIGDNGHRRPEIVVIAVEERAEYPASVPALARIRMRYPDGPHDAESLAVHPDGTLYILTKEFQGNPTAARSAGPVQLFKLSPERRKNATGDPLTLEPVLTLDFAQLLPGASVAARIPTGMDISRDGKRLLILLYADAFEVELDLSKSVPLPASWREGREVLHIKLLNLQQQEGVAYAPDGKSFFYETEKGLGRGSPPARLMQVSCQR